MKCDFCELPQIKKRQVVENDLTWAFLTYTPIVPGHTLIAPKRCVSKYEGLTIDEKSAIEDLRVKVCALMKETFESEGFNFAWNEGKDCGQSVPHFHLHVLPRKKGDSGIYEYEPRKFLYRPGVRDIIPEEELQEIVKLLQSNL
jgi:histidine triad (HIT) family protein